jgi:hypothetical protein
MFIGALFAIANLWNQPRYSTTDDWIGKRCYMFKTGYYSVIKKNKIISFMGKWMELDIIMLSVIIQAQKDKYHMFFLICGI